MPARTLLCTHFRPSDRRKRSAIISAPLGPLRVRGKFLVAGEEKFYVRGVTYGPFRHGDQAEYGSRQSIRDDLKQIAAAGFNAVRVYTVPPPALMDTAADAGLRVLVGVPWAQHLPFLDDRRHWRAVIASVRRAAKEVGDDPALLALSIGHEIPAGVVRWYGHRRMERALGDLCDQARQGAPAALLTYANHPPTDDLELPFLDFVSFNVFVEQPVRLRRYLARLQVIAGTRPLVITEMGADSQCHGGEGQARSVASQVRTVLEAGAAGTFVHSWTDEWHPAGADVEDRAFGLTDRRRNPKPSLAAVREAFGNVPCVPSTLPRASVIVCTFNGARTLGRCLEAARRLDYPEYEVIVVDDGSTDRTAEIAEEFPVRLIRTVNRGLGSARNTGLAGATGEFVAYLDDDAYPDAHWLQYLAHTLREGHAGAGGPNLPVPGDGWVAACVAQTAGNPTHVLLSDSVAERLPGCNMAYWKSALESIGGFDARFRVAGDEADVCRRFQDRGMTLGFSPGAIVWHHRRRTLRSFWRQQFRYGRAEAGLERKWPGEYTALGRAALTGRLRGQGAPPAPEQRGMARVRHVYPARHGLVWSLLTVPEWYGVTALAGVLSVLGLVWPPMLLFGLLAAAMAISSAARAAVHGIRARFDEAPRSPWAAGRMRVLTALLFLMQPIARLSGRLSYALTPWRLWGVRGMASPLPRTVEVWCKRRRDPAARLADLEETLKRAGAVVLRGHESARWDLEVRAGLIGRVRIRQFSADLANGAQYVRRTARPRCAPLGVAIVVLLVAASVGAALRGTLLLAGAAWLPAALLVLLMLRELGAAMAAFAGAAAETPRTAPPS